VTDGDVRMYVALDVSRLGDAVAMARAVALPGVGLKVGLELIWAHGPAAVRTLSAYAPVLVDAKLHDIPQTVERACLQIGALGASAVTLHALGGVQMLARGIAALGRGAAAAGLAAPAALAVTVLTSHDEASVRDEVGLADTAAAATVRLAALAVGAGAAGVVCSPLEAGAVRARIGPAPAIVTPGVRPGAIAGDDQRRVATPAAAVAAGASAVVVGRPVTGAPDPRAAADAILRDLRPVRAGAAAVRA